MKEFAGLNGHDIEQLIVTIETSLRINKRFQFYLWAQGALQSFIPHETLLCAHGDISRMRFRHETFSSALSDSQLEREVGDPVSGLLPRVLDGWLRKGCVPQLLGPAGAGHKGHDFGYLAAHGPSEIKGEFGSFFVFVRLPGRPAAREGYLLDLLMPYLHMALYRMLASESGARAARPRVKGLLSARETEVLQWVKNGKTNDEIGQILGISATTAKNHIQKILRKLNVSNRAQAVGRGVALHLLPPGE